MVSRGILKNVLIAVNKSTVPADIPVGIKVDKDNGFLKDFFCDNEGKAYNDETKVFARITVSILIPNNVQLQTGNIDQGVYSGLAEIDDPFLTFWLKNLNKHNSN